MRSSNDKYTQAMISLSLLSICSSQWHFGSLHFLRIVGASARMVPLKLNDRMKVSQIVRG